MKIIGIIMILSGIFGIFYTGQGSERGQIVSHSPEGNLAQEFRKGDTNFDKEIRNGFIGGVIMIGLGIVFLVVDSKEKGEDEN